jgi:hypothetical protein
MNAQSLPKARDTMPMALREFEPDVVAVPPIIAMLRVLAPACRAKARLDLFHACAMLSVDRTQAAQGFADALLRTLEQGLARAPVLHRAGSIELSFDEAWLAALLAADARGDVDSFTFLTRARLNRAAVRQIGFLVTGLQRRMAA